VPVIVNINDIADYLAFFIAHHRFYARQLFYFSDVFPNYFQSAAARNMAGNLHKNIQNRKVADYAIVDIYFHNFLRLYFRSEHRNNSIVGTHKIMAVHQNRNVLIFRIQFRIYTDYMYASLRKTLVGILDYIGSFVKMKRRDGVRDINNFGIFHFGVNSSFYRANKVIFFPKIGRKCNYWHKWIVDIFLKELPQK